MKELRNFIKFDLELRERRQKRIERKKQTKLKEFGFRGF